MLFSTSWQYNHASKMALASGTRLGTYTVTALIGAGGMGEVEAVCGREATLRRAGSPQPKSRVQRGISLNA